MWNQFLPSSIEASKASLARTEKALAVPKMPPKKSSPPPPPAPKPAPATATTTTATTATTTTKKPVAAFNPYKQQSNAPPSRQVKNPNKPDPFSTETPYSPTKYTLSQTFAPSSTSGFHHSNGPVSNSVRGALSGPNPQTAVNNRESHSTLDPRYLHVNSQLDTEKHPLLHLLNSIPYRVSPIVPDFIMGATRCAIFCELNYHLLNPDYIQRRVDELRGDFDLRVILIHATKENVASHQNVMTKLAVMAMKNETSLIICETLEECVRWLESFKIYENKPTTMIEPSEDGYKPHASSLNKRGGKGETVEEAFRNRAINGITTVHSLNRTDASMLLKEFKTFGKVCTAESGELSLVEGLGGKKVKRLREIMTKPWRTAKDKVDVDATTTTTTK
ncbi:hypothetical protein TrST_g12486 [Triparma strigata]|uniref:ERCC1-like central domain-containing protein n=1 Tax=Triparma strigata TaxID=1606541 RepID=A0A9W7B225_9STRA|nr:hypothetical protein TrST_g12486 [Triparma strigata]